MAQAQPRGQALKDTKPEDLSLFWGHVITVLAYSLPLAILFAIGFSVGNIYTALAFAIIWSGLFLATSVRIVRKRTFIVIERFGYFWKTKYAGLRIIIPWIDIPILRDDFLQKQVKLFLREGSPIEIDFVDGSAPIDVSAWYQIANPDDVETGNWPEVEKQILKYTYRIRANERPSRVAEVFQGAFRTFLEGAKKIQEVQPEMENIARDGTNAAKNALAEMGVYPFPEKGIIVRDIALPQAIIEFREQQLRGEADAKEAVNRSRSYWEPLAQMKEGLAKAGIRMDDDQLLRLFTMRVGLETIQNTKANISFVSPDIDSVLKTITVGSTGGTSRPSQGGTS
jgi:regulator of protease activity HflC (stomatin/prohibitin superfamily)